MQERTADWNQGWQDFIIGLAMSSAFIEAVMAGVVLWHQHSPATEPAHTQTQLVVSIIGVALPAALIVGSYAAMATWLYRTTLCLRSLGSAGPSPYWLGSVAIFWVTLAGVVASLLVDHGTAPTDSGRMTADLIRVATGGACAWLAVYVRRDIDGLLSAAEPAENEDAVALSAP